MSLTIGDVAWAIGGDLTGFDASMKQAERAAERTGDSIGKRLKSALSPLNLLGDFGKGMVLGAGIAGFNALTGAIDGAVNAIPNLVEKGKQYALVVDDIADRTGASAESASKLASAMLILGVPIEGLSAGLRTLSSEIVTNEDHLNSLGIATRDANGISLDTVAVLDNVRRYMAANVDGADKLKTAQELLGRSGGDWIDLLNLTDAQYQVVTDRARQYGLILDESVRAEGEKAAREQNALNAALTGLGVTLFAEVGPMIRAAVGGFTQFIVDNMETIKTTIANVVNFIGGAFVGLFGGESFEGLDLLSEEIASLGGAPATEVDKLRSRLGELGDERKKLIAQQPKDTASTKAATDAIDAQTAAIDRQLGKLREKQAAEERTFQRELAGLAAVYARQVAALDAAEAALEVDRQRQDLAIALAAAQEDLRKAQSAGPGGTIDFAAEASARARILEIGAQQREAARAAEVAEQRKSRDDTRAYIESIAALEAGSENKKALARNLATRERALEEQRQAALARGDTEEAGQLAARIEAIKTAETRTQSAIRAGTTESELTRTKAQLEETKKAITSSIGGGSTEAAKTFRKNLKDVDDDIATTRGALNALTTSTAGNDLRHNTGAGAPAPLGTGGTLEKGWTKFAADGVEAGKRIRAEFDAVLGVLQEIARVLGDLGNWKAPDIIDWILSTFNPAWRLMPEEERKKILGAGIEVVKNQDGGGAGGSIDGKAFGGLIPAGSVAIVGEAGQPELARSLPGGGTWITPLGPSVVAGSPAMSVPAMGGDARFVLETHVYIGEREVVDLLDEALARKRRS